MVDHQLLRRYGTHPGGAHLAVVRQHVARQLQAQGVDVMAAMFDNDASGFTEAYDPNAEPGEIPADMLEDQVAAEGEPEA